jgi:hypothetical protein
VEQKDVSAICLRILSALRRRSNKALGGGWESDEAFKKGTKTMGEEVMSEGMACRRWLLEDGRSEGLWLHLSHAALEEEGASRLGNQDHVSTPLTEVTWDSTSYPECVCLNLLIHFSGIL